ncbi:MAG: hypothetical protein JGK26_18005 [Microcoleus sp. PH2017_27_LUM_O_A]|uniref:hypothetical protein n=1 Tax=unclassified Microcoleus TaxID=2642155 RepID=UPI001DA9DF87|nr:MULTISPECIES: hypothetical protein [unclassified Microcoleus]MCC3461803.1 hypothetical protein [Microcoleus sp. PH2017_11_PCY_U_A]MCC3480217.1 hypothetical protein [Microcoleus sp. PH2017_12_PCY_D_A]MCC3560993.1 hypothetical protein [Microcoleus sp. PH2017_27_LUM_O_A]
MPERLSAVRRQHTGGTLAVSCWLSWTFYALTGSQMPNDGILKLSRIVGGDRL